MTYLKPSETDRREGRRFGFRFESRSEVWFRVSDVVLSIAAMGLNSVCVIPFLDNKFRVLESAAGETGNGGPSHSLKQACTTEKLANGVSAVEKGGRKVWTSRVKESNTCAIPPSVTQTKFGWETILEG
jgi:hypothetical protein